MTEKRLTLYFLPGSYYSQKAAMVLFEKEIPFNHHYLNLNTGEHMEPWYLKLNKLGQVPVLKDGEKVISESEDIINFVDQQYNTSSSLVLVGNADYNNINSQLTQNVPIEIITYGTYLHQDMVMAKLHPTFSSSPEEILASINGIIQRAILYATQHRDLKEEYLKKAENMTQFRNSVLNRDKVQQCIDSLQTVFDQLESQLTKSASTNQETWLFNTDFTSADITLTVLLNRLVFLGQDSRYFTEQNRSYVYQYWQRVQKRKCYQDMMTCVNNYNLKNWLSARISRLIVYMEVIRNGGSSLAMRESRWLNDQVTGLVRSLILSTRRSPFQPYRF